MLNIKTDSKLKNQAQEIAKDLGLSLSVILNNYLRELVNERRVVFTDHPMPNKKTEKILNQAMRELEEDKDKHFSPGFTNSHDLDKWLKRK